MTQDEKDEKLQPLADKLAEMLRAMIDDYEYFETPSEFIMRFMTFSAGFLNKVSECKK